MSGLNFWILQVRQLQQRLVVPVVPPLIQARLVLLAQVVPYRVPLHCRTLIKRKMDLHGGGMMMVVLQVEQHDTTQMTSFCRVQES